ncbi:MAG: hypothetical protein MJZ01_00970 [Bacteroidales bacterium]|nr:hypothetical protein [Bacteroidales bacterium]
MKKTSFLSLVAMIFASTSIMAQTTWYVSASTGGNKKAGTSADLPLKNIQKAIDKAADGDIIKVAEGNYFGTLDKGSIELSKLVTIEGGYSSDFSTRDVLKHATTIMPNAASNGTANGSGTIVVDYSKRNGYAMDKTITRLPDNGKLVFDGLIFDRGNSIAYRYKKDNREDAGWPEGIETPMMQPIGTAGFNGNFSSEATIEPDVFTNESPIISLSTTPVPYELTIKNCAFINCPNYAIRGLFAGKATISNNIFVNVRMAAVEVRGCDNKVNAEMYFNYNTVLFCWARKKDLGDMGYGFRYMPGTNQYLEHNIIGCTTFAGLDRTHVDSDKTKEAKRVTTANHNLFFLNKQADLTLPGGGMFQRIWNKQFDDVDQLAESDGNKDLDPKMLQGIIDETYLNEFLHISYTETASVDRNSAANQFRSAMGMNIQGTISSRVTMYANRYNHDKALKFFGAVKGYGAQMPK